MNSSLFDLRILARGTAVLAYAAATLCMVLAGACGADSSADSTDDSLAADAGIVSEPEAMHGDEVESAPRDSGRSDTSFRDASSRDSDAPATDARAPVPGGRGVRDAGPRASDGGVRGVRVTDATTGADDASTQPSTLKFVGNITTRGQVGSDFADMWNQITPENEGKWGSVEPTRDQMNWGGVDRVHAYAKQHGLVFKQHTFVWGSQQPNWLAGLSAADQRAEVEEWIRLFCERYPDVAQIDVVNEPPPHTMPVYMEALGGAGKSGYDWIVQSFKWAHQYCPNAKLLLNDYNNIEYGADNTRFINIVKAIQAAGAPIDAVGAQAHDAFKLPTATVQKFIDQLASATGLPVYITEYDINLADDARQKEVMESQFTMFWQHRSVDGITLWGYVVGATWRPDTGLMAESGAKRPALSWLLGFIGR